VTTDRYRETGDGLMSDTLGTRAKNATFFLTVSWNFSSTPTTAPIITSTNNIVLADFGLDIVTPPPIWDSSGRYIDPIATETMLLDLLSPYLTSTRFSVFRNGSSHESNLEMVTDYNLQTMSDVTGSGFKKLKGAQVIVNPMTSSKKSFSTTLVKDGEESVTTSWNAGGGGSNTYAAVVLKIVVKSPATLGFSKSAYLGLILPLTRPAVLNDSDSVFQDAYAKVSSAEIEVLSTLAEANKTVSFIRDKMAQVARTIKNVRRGDFSFLGKTTKSDVRDYWLEARYAVRPLMYDIQGAIKAIEKDTLSPLQRFGSRKTNSGTNSISTTGSFDGYSYAFECSEMWEEVLSAAVYGRLRFNLPGQSATGVFNLATTAWDLVPFSFVVDWFVNTAGFFRSLNPNPIYNVEGGFQSVRQTTHVVGICTITDIDGHEAVVPINYNSVHYVRSPNAEPSFINFDLNLSVPKIIDLLAIASK